MPTFFGKEPVVWIGIIATVVIAIVQTLSGQGVISDVTAGKALDATNAMTQLLTLLAPIIAGLLARTQVTPVANPALPSGTTVTVLTPPASPNTTTVLP